MKAEPSLEMANEEIDKMLVAIAKAQAILASQQANVDSLETKSTEAATAASEALDTATDLETKAQAALAEAIAVIDSLITYK